jgi:hypothetical protein
MIKSRSSLAIIVMVSMSLFLIQCNNPNQAPNVAVRNDTIKKITGMAREMTELFNSPGVNTELPNLWAPAADFLALNGNVAFRFYIDNANDLTVHGWEQPYNNSGPAIFMQTSTLSGEILSNRVYLGNLYISASVVAQIKQLIQQGNYSTVIFQPVIDTRPGSVGQLIYKVKLASAIPQLKSAIPKDSLQAYTDTSAVQFLSGGTTNSGILLNPSPPRNE